MRDRPRARKQQLCIPPNEIPQLLLDTISRSMQRSYVRTMRSTIRLGSESVERETSANCVFVDNPVSAATLTRSGGVNPCAACLRRFALCPPPALPLEAGFQGGAAPLGVPQKDRSERDGEVGVEREKGPTSASSVERNSRPFAYSF